MTSASSAPYSQPTPTTLAMIALSGIPEVGPGMALAPLIMDALARGGHALSGNDVLLVCQKVVSKSEGRTVDLRTVTISARAQEIADRCGKDPRLVEVILRESIAVVRCAPDVLIVRHRLGLVMANAGVDQSNVPDHDWQVLLLPIDPDASAAALRGELAELAQIEGEPPAVVITDTFGRPWRRGVCGVAIGTSGMVSLLDRRGEHDRFGRALKVTQVAVADALAAAAALLTGEGAEGRPVVLAAGALAADRVRNGTATELIRPVAEDLFR